ncbi:Small glutamine-rich tetratricopeptide repeat-containing protein 2 [Collariella sp. IMI 366227]|nr:Small glutamine-rich tetratricopeptide repeat-containing protein 2 [Collariella sp. IMI 366227]
MEVLSDVDRDELGSRLVPPPQAAPGAGHLRLLVDLLTDGTLQAEEKDSIEVAINCIGESFGSLFQIYSVYEKLKQAAPKAALHLHRHPQTTPSSNLPTEDQKKQAEALNQRQRRHGRARLPLAITLYTQALALHPGNAIFLSNRAAAYSAAKDHEAARADAEAAVAVDPKYTKAWSRLGLARFALGDAKGAMEAYQKGIEHEGNGGSCGAAARGGGAGGAGSPGLADLAGMFGGGGGAGGAGGGGGMPDFASIMNNPMFASMAQNLMSNPDMMANLMQNPRLREMADRFSGGGGMPDVGSLMSDPSIAEMAKNLMGGGGRGGPGGPAGPGAGR